MKAQSGLFTLTILAGGMINCCPCTALDENDHTIVQGTRIGIVELGKNKVQVKSALGNFDGSYELPLGITVDYAEWKEPNKTSTIKVFYGQHGKAVQISSAAPVPATKSGLSTKSTVADVTKKYKGMQVREFRGKDCRIAYHDAVTKGIAFKFIKRDGEAAQTCDAIIVHLPRQIVIADRDETPINEKGEK